mmetsp:Transcript_35380/g.91931  ORF Transcript_35380/g.91931 Transcript_35380/m.91931 type:complete len:446 (-) Transcript_35380:530-1867(-)
MEHSRKLLVLGGLLLAMQLAAAGRPLFGLHTGARTVDGAQVKRLRRYVSTLPSAELREMLVADPHTDSNKFDQHYMELGHYEVTPDDRAKMQSEVKQYWQHFRANEVEEEQYEDLNDYLDEDFEPIWEDEDEWLEKFSDWYEEDEDYPEGEEEEEEYIEEDAVEPARPQNKLDLGQDEYDYEEEEEEETQQDAGFGVDDVEDGEDWVLRLASAMRTGDSKALEDAVHTAIEAGDKEALRELVGEAGEMANGVLLQSIWTQLTGEAAGEINEEEKYTSAYALEDEADEMEEEAQEFIGEAEDLKMEADALEREAESIVEGADEYERMEATDELGEAADALDTEATKLELESAKLRSEVSRLEAESSRLRGMSVSGTDTEADWLDEEAGRLSGEANKLQEEAEELKGKADSLDGEADRIDRIEENSYAKEAAARQSRIDEVGPVTRP